MSLETLTTTTSIKKNLFYSVHIKPWPSQCTSYFSYFLISIHILTPFLGRRRHRQNNAIFCYPNQPLELFQDMLFFLIIFLYKLIF